MKLWLFFLRQVLNANNRGIKGGKGYAIYWADISLKGSITKIIILVDYLSRFCVNKVTQGLSLFIVMAAGIKTSLSAHQFLSSSDRANKNKNKNK